MNRISAFAEFGVYFSKDLKKLQTNKKNLLIMMLFPVAAMLITVWIAGEDMFVNSEGTKSGCFVLVSAAIWGGVFNSIQTVVKERETVKRDYNSGIRFRCYILSKALVQFIICVFQSIILTGAFVGVKQIYENDVIEEGIILSSALVEYYISILLLMYAADMLGLVISCCVRKSETASVASPYVLIVQLIFSGILFEMEGFSDTLAKLMISRWGMEALGSISDLNGLPSRIQESFPMYEMEAKDMFLRTSEHIGQVWAILLVFSIVSIILADIVIHGIAKDR